MAKQDFSSVIKLANSGKKYPVMNLVREDPSLAAVISKLVSPPVKPTYGADGNRANDVPNLAQFVAASAQVSTNISDAKTALQLLPDMELSAQILTSSVLSPKDMTTVELTFTPPEGLLDSDTAAAMILRLQTHFERDYKIKPLLQKILRDMLFETGSYPIAVIPENSLDEAINGDHRVTMEHLAEHINPDGTVKPTGLLGPTTLPKPERLRPGLAMESLETYSFNKEISSAVTFDNPDYGFKSGGVEDSFLTVIDNPSVLKIPVLQRRIREARVLDAIGVKSLESFSHKLNDRQLSGLVYKTRDYGYRPIATLKTQEQLKRRTVGMPLITKFPSESVIPVHVPGSPHLHIGYFVMMDGEGYPISRASNSDHYQQMSQRLSGANGGFASSMFAKVQNGMEGFNIGNSTHLDYSKRTFANMAEADFLARLRNGVYGNGVALAKNDELYQIMLARMLAKQHTQMLFLPVELMTYFAFRYDHNGIGESLLDGMKIINSLRSMLMFADVMAAIRNSIGRTEVKLKLDETDPDPKKSIEIMQHEIVMSRKQAFPLGANSPTDLVDYLSKAGYEFSYEGHPGLPDVSVDFSEKATQYTKPDNDLAEFLRKAAIMSVGLSPENVDAGFQAEFATSILHNNLLLSKRVMTIQEEFTPQVADHCRKVAMNTEELCQDLINIIAENFDKLEVEKVAEGSEEDKANSKQFICDKVLRDFLMNFEVSLPQPNSITLDNQLEAMKTYSEALDQGLDWFISDKFFTSEVGGDVAAEVGVVREIVKAKKMREWMATNGVLPELAEIVTMGEDGKPMTDFMESQAGHIEALMQGMGDLMKGLAPIKTKVNEELAAAAPELAGGGDAGGGDDQGGDGGADADDPFGGDGSEDDFNMDNLDDDAGAGGDGATDNAGGDDQGGSTGERPAADTTALPEDEEPEMPEEPEPDADTKPVPKSPDEKDAKS